MNLQSFKSYAPISDSRLNTHIAKEDTLNRHIEPMTLACMFGDFETWQYSHKAEIQESELGTWRFKVFLPYMCPTYCYAQLSNVNLA